MRILAIGDFHGKFPKKLLKIAGRKDIDLILSTGDYCGNKELGRLFFKYAYDTDKELWEFIGKKKANELDKDNFLAGIKVLKKLSQIKKKVIGVKGNWDPVNWGDIGFPNKRDKYTRKFNSIVKRLGIKIVDFKSYNLHGINFVGYPRSTYPGKITKHIEEKMKKREGKNFKIILKKIKKDNRELYKKFKSKFKEDTIFISHNCPNNTKLDLIKKGSQKGKHYGSYLTRKIISELQPRLAICGHIHENQGKVGIGKAIVVNPGAAYEGKAAIIDFDENKGKIEKIKFVR